jgi:dolichol-phosphate mannosyltransferase
VPLAFLQHALKQVRSKRSSWLSADSQPGTLVRFGLVGLSGLLVNQLLLWTEVERLRVHYLAAAVVATQGSTVWNFALTERWVYPRRRAGRRPLRFAAFALVNNATLLLRLPLMAVLTSLNGVHYLASNFITLALLFLCRFLVSDRFIWRPAKALRALRAAPAPGLVDPLQRPPAAAARSTTTGAAGRRHRYDVGGFVAIESAVPLRELAHFERAELERPADIVVRVGMVGHHRPRWRPVVTHAPEFVSYQEHLGRIGANFRLDFTDRIDVTVGPLLACSPHVVYTNVIEALLRFVLVSQGRILLHSATLELDGCGVMLTARTDTGKTGTILRLLRERSGRFLSDDMTIVDPDGLAYCYPKPLTISAHTLRAVNHDALRLHEQLKLAVQSRLHSKRGRSVGSRLADMNLPIMALNAVTQAIVPPPKYMVDRLVPCEFADSTRVRELFVIERGPAAMEELDHDRAIDIMLENTDDAYGFPPFRYFAPAIAIGGEDYVRLRERERELVAKFLADVRVRRLARDDFSWADAIPELVADREDAWFDQGWTA